MLAKCEAKVGHFSGTLYNTNRIVKQAQQQQPTNQPSVGVINRQVK